MPSVKGTARASNALPTIPMAHVVTNNPNLYLTKHSHVPIRKIVLGNPEDKTQNEAPRGLIGCMKPTVIPTNETVPVLGLQLPIHIFFCLLHGDVHVTIQTRQNS